MASIWDLSAQERIYLFACQAEEYGLIVFDPRGNIAEWSCGAQHLMGWSGKEAVGRPASLIFTPEDCATGAPQTEMETARDKGKASDFRWHVRKDGSRFFADGELLPFRGADGKLLGFGKILHDVTRRKQLADALEQQASLLHYADDAVFSWEFENGLIRYWNNGAQALYGYAANEAIGKAGQRLLRISSAEGFAAIKSKLRQAGRWQGVLRHTTKSGMRLQIESRMLLRTDLGERPLVLETDRDVTAWKRAEESLRASEERFRQLAELSPDGILVTLDNRFVYANRAAARLLAAKDAGALLGRSPFDLAEPQYHELVGERIDMVLHRRYSAPLTEQCWRRLDGAAIYVQTTAGRVSWEGRPAVQVLFRDNTAQRESAELAWRHANLDPLTGLPNRRQFHERLALELRKAKRSNHPLALLFIDLDGFKQINDLHGHEAGDQLLVEAAQRIQHCVRETDSVARLGGDEFTIILTDLTDPDHVKVSCQDILIRLAKPFRVSKETAHISASIGVSIYPLDAANAEDLLRKADQAMYAAKRAGKNQFNYFTREMDQRAHFRLRLTNELRHALRDQQLSVHYQPVVDLASGDIVKAEALLRWCHPTLGNIGPAEFIPMAEESGLIKQIGNWVFHEAAVCCKRCSEQRHAPFQISVNESPIQFMSGNADAPWLHYLAEHDMPGSSITVEITEGVLLHASSKIADKLHEYKQAGVQVALDDFGTGYASLSYLRKFHIDYVKIDQPFVHNLSSDANSRTIAETIIMMAHKLGQQVIAEGVETREQLHYLVAAGCDYGQGYWFSSPVPADRLIEMMGQDSHMRSRLIFDKPFIV